MSEAIDRKMKRKRRLEELKATKVMRACKSWRRYALANHLLANNGEKIERSRKPQSSYMG